MKIKVSLLELKKEIEQIRNRNPALKEDSAFVLWFLQAYLVDSADDAKRALTGVKGDKNNDAILIDDKSKQVNIVQGKFHSTEGFAEKRNDILGFADLIARCGASKHEIDIFCKKMDPLASKKFKEAANLVQEKNYTLKLFYVTTGKCSQSLIDEAKERAEQSELPAEIYIFDYNRVLTIFKDYLEGLAPAVPVLKLHIISEGKIQHEGIIHRFDPERKIESWVFSMSGKDIGEMYANTGVRLFARNIRGYVGNTDINESISETIKKEPHNFWYYNNGVTIVCDDAKREVQGNEDVLRVEGAQVINGQQTTRTLQATQHNGTNVLVKVIKIPRSAGDNLEYDCLVNSIVRATNWQNHIESSDLVSNDHIQVFLERELRKVGYQYIRKRMTKSEARCLFGQGYRQIDKKELAQAIGGCEFDPAIVRKGKERLFEDPYYKSIFGSHSLSYYLSRYWLMRQVSYAARGYPERAYAKWLVLNFSWKNLGNIIGSGTSEKCFRCSCEKDSKPVIILAQIHTNIFKAALKFYRLKRGKGAEAKDISTFFQRSKLDREFQAFWNSGKNRYRKNVASKIKKFKDALEKIELE